MVLVVKILSQGTYESICPIWSNMVTGGLLFKFWKWVSEWLNLKAFLGTADREVHISRVIIAYTFNMKLCLNNVYSYMYKLMYIVQHSYLDINAYIGLSSFSNTAHPKNVHLLSL